MKPCLFCKQNEMSIGLLCKECVVLISKDVKAKKKWDKLRGRKQKTLKRFRKELLYKPTASQKKAYHYIKRVADIYFVPLQSERIFGSYIIDIYIPRFRVGIEIDGGIHKNQLGYDDDRDNYLKNHGIAIYRFENREIGSAFFKNAVWQIFNINYVHTHYNQILKAAKQNKINLKLK